MADLEAVELRLLDALALPAVELAAEGVADPYAVDRGAVGALTFSAPTVCRHAALSGRSR